MVKSLFVLILLFAVFAAVLALIGPGVSAQESAGIADSAVAAPFDSDIERALTLLEGTASGGPLVKLVREFHAQGGEIVFESIDTRPNQLVLGDFGGFSRGQNSSRLTGKIRINDQLRASPEIVAAVMAHEATHLQDALTGQDVPTEVMGCLDGEAKAVVASMRAWSELRPQFSAAAVPQSISVTSAYNALDYQYSLFSDLAVPSNSAAALAEISSVIEQDYAAQCLSISANAQEEQAYLATLKDQVEKSYMAVESPADPFVTSSEASQSWSTTRPGGQNLLSAMIYDLESIRWRAVFNR